MQPYQEALTLARGEGKKCSTLGELVQYVIDIVSDASLVKPHDQPSLKPIEVEPHRWWYRGVSSDFPLDAGLFRIDLQQVKYPTLPETYGDLEKWIQHEYAQMTRGRFENVSGNPWDRLFEMQHYGLPTRLLDWSMNLGQAIWFALQGADEKDHDPVIWILNPRLLSKVSLDEAALFDFAYLELYGSERELRHWNLAFAEDTPAFGRAGWILDSLVAHQDKGHFPIIASWTNPRLAAQMGAFTLQAGRRNRKSPSLEQYAQKARDKGYTPFLYKVRLDRSCIREAAKTLAFLGVNEWTMFPELYKTCSWVKGLRNLKP